MPSQTGNVKLPYPLSSEPVAAGADNIRQLAEALDIRVAFAMSWGAPGFGTIAAGASTTITATFPVGRFAVAPYVVCTPNGVSKLTVAVSALTAASMTVMVTNFDSVARPASCYWIGIQATG